MAPSRNIPPDKLVIQTCCKSKLTAVVCLICNKLYHGSCPDHENTNLTSNLSEDIDSISEKARFIIAQIKSMKNLK